MRVWSYNEDKLLINPQGRVLRRDPLNGGYLAMRENETDKEPPITCDNEIAKWSDGSWTIVPDFRGKTYFDKTTRELQQITDVEIEPETNWTDKEPPMEPYYEFSESEGDWIVSLPLLREFQKRQIHGACESEMKTHNQGYVSPTIGTRIDCRENDVIRLDQLIALYESQGAEDTVSINYICHDNSIIPVTLADVKAAKLEITNELMNMLYRKHTVYAQIDVAQTEEAIKAVDWVWPTL